MGTQIRSSVVFAARPLITLRCAGERGAENCARQPRVGAEKSIPRSRLARVVVVCTQITGCSLAASSRRFNGRAAPGARYINRECVPQTTDALSLLHSPRSFPAWCAAVRPLDAAVMVIADLSPLSPFSSWSRGVHIVYARPVLLAVTIDEVQIVTSGLHGVAYVLSHKNTDLLGSGKENYSHTIESRLSVHQTDLMRTLPLFCLVLTGRDSSRLLHPP